MTIAIGNETEVEVAIGERDAETAATRLLELGVELAIVKRGAEGVLAATRSSVIEVPPVRLKVLNGLGAGDAFGGALAHALVQGWSLEAAVELANAAGALAASRLACADDFGTQEEIESVLNGSPRHRRMTLLVHPDCQSGRGRDHPACDTGIGGLAVRRVRGPELGRRRRGASATPATARLCVVVISGAVDIESDHGELAEHRRPEGSLVRSAGCRLSTAAHQLQRAPVRRRRDGGRGGAVLGTGPAGRPRRACSQAPRSNPRRADTRPWNGRSTRS